MRLSDDPHAPADGSSARPEDASSSEPKMRAFAAGPNGVHVLDLEAAAQRVSARLAGEAGKGEGVVWIDLLRPGEPEGDFLRTRLGLHPLAVEDCLRGRQRPKLDPYPAYLFVVCYSAHLNPARQRVAFNELHLFVGEGFLVTVRFHRSDELRETLARWRALPDRLPTAGALAHALLDSVVDGYFPILDHLSERADAVETQMFEDRHEGMQQILDLRRELVLFRRIVAPERDLLGTLLRRELPVVGPELVPYFQDVRDHTMRITEEIDMLRDLLAATMEGQLSAASNQLNVTVRMLTAWSIILMSMTVVAGVYGMNFVAMPELGWRYGYAFALALMLGIGAGVFWFFRRRRWI